MLLLHVCRIAEEHSLMLNEMTNGSSYFISDNGEYEKKQGSNIINIILMTPLDITKGMVIGD